MKKSVKILVVTLLLVSLFSMTAGASGALADSQIGKGIMAMLKDASSFLMTIGPISGAVFAIGCLIASNMSTEENDTLKWKKRSKNAAIGAVLVLLVGMIINLIAGYFGVQTNLFYEVAACLVL